MVLNLRLKQAETAFNGGCLDEAFELADDREIRQQRRGQELIGKLAMALADRGRNHLQNHHLNQALNDCRKAEILAGNIPQIASLKQAVTDAVNNRQQNQQHNGDKFKHVLRHIEQGWLSSAEQILDGAGDDHGHTELLKEKINARRQDLEIAMKKAREALERSDLSAAFQTLQDCGKVREQRRELAELWGKITQNALQITQDTLAQGRLDLTKWYLETLAPHMNNNLQWQELQHIYEQLQRAARHIRQGKFRPGLNTLRQVQNILPDYPWLNNAIEQLHKTAEALETIQTGPLGWVLPPSTQPDDSGENLPTKPSPSFITPFDEPAMKQSINTYNAALMPEPLPEKYILQLDGIGSYLILRNPKITIGPISGNKPADIGLVAGPDIPQVIIERMDEDYFLRSRGPVRVGGAVLNSPNKKLLGSQEKIELSPRCYLEFKRPHAASATAIVSFSGARYPQMDIRNAVLLDREIIIGPGKSAHIRNERANETITLVDKDGRLTCRSEEPVIIDGKPAEKTDRLPLETPIKMGSLSMVLVRT